MTAKQPLTAIHPNRIFSPVSESLGGLKLLNAGVPLREDSHLCKEILFRVATNGGTLSESRYRLSAEQKY
eukprot:scaffold3954_cov152-Skeletonema_menzelii.AAC.2